LSRGREPVDDHVGPRVESSSPLGRLSTPGGVHPVPVPNGQGRPSTFPPNETSLVAPRPVSTPPSSGDVEVARSTWRLRHRRVARSISSRLAPLGRRRAHPATLVVTHVFLLRLSTPTPTPRSVSQARPSALRSRAAFCGGHELGLGPPMRSPSAVPQNTLSVRCHASTRFAGRSPVSPAARSRRREIMGTVGIGRRKKQIDRLRRGNRAGRGVGVATLLRRWDQVPSVYAEPSAAIRLRDPAAGPAVFRQVHADHRAAPFRSTRRGPATITSAQR